MYTVNISSIGTDDYSIVNVVEWELANGVLKVKCSRGELHYIFPGHYRSFSAIPEQIREVKKRSK